MRNLSGNKPGNMVDLHFCLGRQINTLPRYWHLFLSRVMVYISLASFTSREFTFLLLLDKVHCGLSNYL